MPRYGSNLYGSDITLEEKHPELSTEDPFDYRRTLGDDYTPTGRYKKKMVSNGKSKWNNRKRRKKG